MKVPAEKIKQLREQTGAGMVDCKNALEQSNGEMDEAVKILRKKGMADAEKKLSRQTREGLIASYIHPGSKIGVLVEVNCETDFVAKNEDFKQLVKDITMHIAASNPRYISSDEVPEKAVEEEKEIVRAEFEKKPEEIISKIASGRMEKYFSQHCLLNQPYIKDEDMTVRDYIATYVAKLGENIKIRRFVRFHLGEEN